MPKVASMVRSCAREHCIVTLVVIWLPTSLQQVFLPSTLFILHNTAFSGTHHASIMFSAVLG
jgi:hypothetical protein